jgi:predicted nucleic acid-binding protein
MSVADAWIAGCAMECGAVLVHENREFGSVPIRQQALPWKP